MSCGILLAAKQHGECQVTAWQKMQFASTATKSQSAGPFRGVFLYNNFIIIIIIIIVLPSLQPGERVAKAACETKNETREICVQNDTVCSLSCCCWPWGEARWQVSEAAESWMEFQRHLAVFTLILAKVWCKTSRDDMALDYLFLSPIF